MMDWTDRHCRYFLRQISRHTRLYTEMVTTGALIHGDRERFLRFDPAEHPLALQLGGSDPGELAACARLGEDWGYDEINLNLGCPSERVQSGRFGACLMAEPKLVGECIAAMKAAVDVPVTAKLRIGIDHRDSYPEFLAFATGLVEAGCDALLVHARKAWLQGLSAKENRAIPPLRYDWVYRLKAAFPEVPVVLNGGVTSLAQTLDLLSRVDGVMIGRAAYHDPWLLADADRLVFGDCRPAPDPHQVLEAMLPYVRNELEAGVYLSRISRHLLGLFQGRPGARAWRRHLSEHAHRAGADAGVLMDAAARVR